MEKQKLYKTTIIIYTDTDVTNCSLRSIGCKKVCKPVDINATPSNVREFFGESWDKL